MDDVPDLNTATERASKTTGNALRKALIYTHSCGREQHRGARSVIMLCQRPKVTEKGVTRTVLLISFRLLPMTHISCFESHLIKFNCALTDYT